MRSDKLDKYSQMGDGIQFGAKFTVLFTGLFRPHTIFSTFKNKRARSAEYAQKHRRAENAQGISAISCAIYLDRNIRRKAIGILAEQADKK